MPPSLVPMYRANWKGSLQCPLILNVKGATENSGAYPWDHQQDAVKSVAVTLICAAYGLLE